LSSDAAAADSDAPPMADSWWAGAPRVAMRAPLLVLRGLAMPASVVMGRSGPPC